MRSDDHHLLQCFVDDRSEAAFAELVQRHVDLVYSTARRLVGGDRHLAQDVTQTVFADLARKATRLVDHPAPAGWLHRHTFFVASGLVRAEQRRKRREREATDMNDAITPEAAWSLVEGNLDEALNRLGEIDRHAIVLRFFEKQDLRTVGKALGVGEDAAQKRVGRALEKLRVILQRLGVNLPAALLAPALAGHAVTAAPALLPGAVTTAVMSGSAAGTGLLFTLNKLLSMNSIKIVGSIALAGVVATPMVAQHRTITDLRTENAALTQQVETFASFRDELNRLRSQAVDPAELTRLREDHRELLRLRGTLTAMQEAASEDPEPFPIEETEDSVPETEGEGEVFIQIDAVGLEIPSDSHLWTQMNLLSLKNRDGAMTLREHQIRQLLEAIEANGAVSKVFVPPKIMTTPGRQTRVGYSPNDLPETMLAGTEEVGDAGAFFTVADDPGESVLTETEKVGDGVVEIPGTLPPPVLVTSLDFIVKPVGGWNVLEMTVLSRHSEMLNSEGEPPLLRTWSSDQRVSLNLGDGLVVGLKASLSSGDTPASRDHPGIIAVITPSLVDSQGRPFDPNGEVAAPEQAETPEQ